jgi:hypothetical protein
MHQNLGAEANQLQKPIRLTVRAIRASALGIPVPHPQATATNPHEWAANKEEAMEEEEAIKPSKTEAKK